ncbi:MAG: VCBS repeat-containing protein [Myxococcales bacterium]|nr:VCBS repeat-containing protein [Myxococcales bacterium]
MLGGDWNGDGKTDLLDVRSDGSAYAWTSSGAGFTTSLFAGGISDTKRLRVADFNGDGRSDLFRLTPSGQAYFHLSEGGTTRGPFLGPYGLVLDNLRLGDLDGDGRADLLHVKGGQFWVHRAFNEVSVDVLDRFDGEPMPGRPRATFNTTRRGRGSTSRSRTAGAASTLSSSSRTGARRRRGTRRRACIRARKTRGAIRCTRRAGGAVLRGARLDDGGGDAQATALELLRQQSALVPRVHERRRGLQREQPLRRLVGSGRHRWRIAASLGRRWCWRAQRSRSLRSVWRATGRRVGDRGVAGYGVLGRVGAALRSGRRRHRFGRLPNGGHVGAAGHRPLQHPAGGSRWRRSDGSFAARRWRDVAVCQEPRAASLRRGARHHERPRSSHGDRLRVASRIAWCVRTARRGAHVPDGGGERRAVPGARGARLGRRAEHLPIRGARARLDGRGLGFRRVTMRDEVNRIELMQQFRVDLPFEGRVEHSERRWSAPDGRVILIGRSRNDVAFHPGYPKPGIGGFVDAVVQTGAVEESLTSRAARCRASRR